MSLFKAAVVKIQRGQALVKPLRAGPLTAKIVLDGKNVDVFHPGREIIGHVEVTYNQEFPFCGKHAFFLIRFTILCFLCLWK